VRAYLILLLGLWTLTGCGAERTSSALPTDTPDAIATEVASLRATAVAETSRAPTATLAATNTATPTSTRAPADNPAVTPGPTPQPTAAAPLAPPPTVTSTGAPTTLPRIAFSSDRDGKHGIYVMDADGSGVTRVVEVVAARLACSPDGKRISFAASFDTDQNDIYTINVDGTGLRNLTNDAAWNWSSSWSPDGTRIVYNSGRGGRIDLYLTSDDGSGARRLAKLPDDDGSPSWSPDGTKIAFNSSVFAPSADGKAGRAYQGSYVRVINVDGSGVTQLTEEPSGSDTVPTGSPDGKRIAYAHSARIFVMNADGSNKTQLTGGSDWWPQWSPDGTRILYVHLGHPQAEIHVMDVGGGGQVDLTNHPAWDDTPCWLP
jgi:Tol biopolymer transport system component